MSDNNNETPERPEAGSELRLGELILKMPPEQATSLKYLASAPNLSELFRKSVPTEALDSFGIGTSLGETWARMHKPTLPPIFEYTPYPHFTSEIVAGSSEALALEEAANLRRENAVKEVELQKKAEALQIALAAKSATEGEMQSLMRDFGALQKQKDLGYLLERVSPSAADRLLKDESLVKCFEEARTCDAFVLSIDIRRSTDLMLRGKTPQLYAEFLDATCTRIVEKVKCNFGVVDKFTGDGLLAYFPLFFTGIDAGYHTLAVAQACHKAFAELYRSERHRFSVALKDVGLGIGVDFGPVHLCRITRELSVVGSPVVYACRFSGAPAGHTYVNIQLSPNCRSDAQERSPVRRWNSRLNMKERYFVTMSHLQKTIMNQHRRIGLGFPPFEQAAIYQKRLRFQTQPLQIQPTASRARDLGRILADGKHAPRPPPKAPPIAQSGPPLRICTIGRGNGTRWLLSWQRHQQCRRSGAALQAIDPAQISAEWFTFQPASVKPV